MACESLMRETNLIGVLLFVEVGHLQNINIGK